jgi:thioredoxin 1
MMRLSLILLVSALAFFSCSNGQGNQKIPVEQFEKKLADTKDAILLDVRTPGEFNERHLNNATNIDYNGSDFEQRIASLDKTKPVFVYCLSGGRSTGAANLLASKGFKTVYNMEGGILAWANAGKPVVGGAVADGASTMDTYLKSVTKDKLVLVDFNATWCGPCKKLKPIVEKLAKKHSALVELKAIDVDQNTALADAMHINSIPLLILYKQGKEVWRYMGLAAEQEVEKAILDNAK